jgi:anti-sigma-K factor RskA
MPQIPSGVAAKAFAVTIEPAGGVPQPTGAMVQAGSAL